MQVTTEYFVNDWNKQIVLHVYDDNDYVVVERTVHNIEGSIEVSEEVAYFKTKKEALDFLQSLGFDFSEPKEEIEPEWEEIPF